MQTFIILQMILLTYFIDQNQNSQVAVCWELISIVFLMYLIGDQRIITV